MNCPRCRTAIGTQKIGDVEIDRCDRCGGMFLDRGQLNRIAEPTTGDLEYSTVDLDTFRHDDAFGPIDCPSCGAAAMKKVEFVMETGIILDHCESCSGFWLDGRELDRINDEIRQLNAASDSGSDPPLLWLTRFIASLPR